MRSWPIGSGMAARRQSPWARLLASLTPAMLYDLSRKHSLEPFDNEPWVKGFTGGSDDHTGLFIGKTFTVAQAYCPEELLASISRKETRAEGRHNDYQSLAFTVFKATWDSLRDNDASASRSLLGRLTDTLFSGKKMGSLKKFTRM